MVGDSATATMQIATIRDWPAMKVRGLHDDLSRGPVDTLEFQKKIIRTIAAYKDNLYSPYFENTQQYASNPLSAPPRRQHFGFRRARTGCLRRAVPRHRRA